jgi:uncharacterized protein (DUF2147 family)
MRHLKLTITLLIALLYIPLAYASNPTGNWITIDDKTGKKRAEVRLELVNGKLAGTIEKVYPQAGDTGICINCPDGFKDKPVEGLQFLWGCKDSGNGVWAGGQILDPKTGKIYRVKLTMKKNKLYIRGYVGFSMLGRTQVWVRDSSPANQK